jgi:hypothetical protein
VGQEIRGTRRLTDFSPFCNSHNIRVSLLRVVVGIFEASSPSYMFLGLWCFRTTCFGTVLLGWITCYGRLIGCSSCSVEGVLGV